MRHPEVNFEVGVNDLVSSLFKLFRKIGDEVADLFGLGLTDYLLSQSEKYLEINSFLHQDRKIKFSKVYYPISVFGIEEFKAHYLNEPIAQLKSKRFIAIIGNAGSGKSMLTRFVFLSALKEQKKIPILIELRLFNDAHIEFEAYVFRKIVKDKIKANEEILSRALKNGNFLFVFDGYDELYSSRINTVVAEINDFLDQYDRNYFIITSRPGAGAERINRFLPVYISSLTFVDVVDFIYKSIDNFERQQNILKEIRKADNKNYVGYLSNPLLLSMFLLTFSSHPELPKSRAGFYRNVYETLYSRHDGVDNNSFKREKLSGLDKADFENIISIFSYITFVKGMFSFSEEYVTSTLRQIRHNYSDNLRFDEQKVFKDFYTNIGILIKEGTNYQFPHKTLQEYFAANFIHIVAQGAKHKELLYSKFVSTIFSQGQDDYQNFLDICAELDYYNFSKYCLLNGLQKLFNLLGGDRTLYEFKVVNELTLLNVFIANCTISYQVSYYKENRQHPISIKLINFKSIYQPILNQVELNKLLDWFRSGLESADLKAKLQNVIKKNIGELMGTFGQKNQFEINTGDLKIQQTQCMRVIKNVIATHFSGKNFEGKIISTVEKLFKKIALLESNLNQSDYDIEKLLKDVSRKDKNAP